MCKKPKNRLFLLLTLTINCAILDTCKKMTYCLILGGAMALEAFNNLKEKKKANIFSAISRCLRNTSYDELSVNEIVREADISRGSFYNYFLDKNDAVKSMVNNDLRKYFDMYMDAIREANNMLFEGTKNVYKSISDSLRDKINLTIMRNLKFFSELVFESIKSKKYEERLDEIVQWLIDNTLEGQKYLTTKKKMSNVLDMIIILIMNAIFSHTMTNDEVLVENSDFEYKLSILEKGIKE